MGEAELSVVSVGTGERTVEVRFGGNESTGVSNDMMMYITLIYILIVLATTT